VHEFVDFLIARCGINADVDIYYDGSDNIVSWPMWTLQQLKECIDRNGYIILLWSESMEAILNHGDVNDNSSIQMAYAHVDRLSLLNLIQSKIQHFVVVCLNSIMAKDQIRTTLPFNLSQGTVHNISLHNVPVNMPVENLLEQEELTDLRNLLSILMRQQQFMKPDHQVLERPC